MSLSEVDSSDVGVHPDSAVSPPTVFITPSDNHSTPSDSPRDRPSSEATLATIYSMYGDFPSNHPSNAREHPEKLIPARPSESLTPYPSPFDLSDSPVSPEQPAHRSRPPQPVVLPTHSEIIPQKTVVDTLTSSVSAPPHSLSQLTPITLPAQLQPSSSTEDADNLFIRSTYAQLDSTGVEGDGFEEGMERTRARLAQLANTVLPRRQKRDLSEAELKVLNSVDRYVKPHLPNPYQSTL